LDPKIKALKSLITISFWRGMYCAGAFASASWGLVQIIWFGAGSFWLWFFVIFDYILSLIFGLAYLGLHKKIDKLANINDIPEE